MLTIMKKLVGFLSISSIWLLPLSSPEIHAQQIATPQSTSTPSTAITVEHLKSRRLAIENMTDIDASVKSDSLKYVGQAIAYLEKAAITKTKARELTKLIQTAPERLKILQAELKKPFTAPENVEERARQMKTIKLEQRLTQKEAELVTAQTRLQEWSDRLTAEKTIINQTPEQLANATSRLREIQTELDEIADVAETDILNHSRMLNMRSEWENLTAEIKLNEQQKRSHNLLVELFSTERDVAQKKVEGRERMLKNWQVEVHKRRQQEAAQTREDAQEAILDVSLMPKMVQDQFDINIQLSTELETISREEGVLAGKYEDYQSQLETLEAEFETAQKKVESAVLTEAIGLALRQQRLNLPSADQYIEDSDARQVRMSEISERQIGLDRLLREFSDPKTLADHIIGSVSFLSDVNRQSFDSKIQELVTNRLDIIQKLKFVYDRIFKLLQDIEFTEQKLVNTAEDFGEFLDRHLLWIRSSKPVRISDLQRLQVSLGWFFKLDSWGRLFKDLGRSFRQKTAVWLISLLIGVYLIVSRRWSRKKLKDISVCIDQQVEDSFLLTMKALALTVLLALSGPSCWHFRHSN